MLEGDAKAFVQKAKDVNASASLVVAKDRDHMGVVRSLISRRFHDIQTGRGFPR
jgi:hypothetical protein